MTRALAFALAVTWFLLQRDAAKRKREYLSDGCLLNIRRAGL